MAGSISVKGAVDRLRPIHQYKDMILEIHPTRWVPTSNARAGRFKAKMLARIVIDDTCYERRFAG